MTKITVTNIIQFKSAHNGYCPVVDYTLYLSDSFPVSIGFPGFFPVGLNFRQPLLSTNLGFSLDNCLKGTKCHYKVFDT